MPLKNSDRHCFRLHGNHVRPYDIIIISDRYLLHELPSFHIEKSHDNITPLRDINIVSNRLTA
jgi:hypothetical protein